MINKGLSIIEAMESPKYFGSTFRSIETWRHWETYLKSIFCLPMSDEERLFYTQCTARSKVPVRQPHYAFTIVGRRGGKSTISALVAVYLSLFRDWSDSLSYGETGSIFVCASDRAQSRIVFKRIQSLLSLPAFKDEVESVTQDSVRLKNGISIEIRTPSFRGIRGYSVLAAILDEVAFWRNEESSANPDVEVLTALEPSTATVKNPLILAISTPYSKRGVLWSAYREFFGKDDEGILVWKATSKEMNPTIHGLGLRSLFIKDRVAYDAEYNAQFREDLETFMPLELIEELTDFGRKENAVNDSTRYFAFVDASGGRSDSMTMAIAHRSNELVIIDRLVEQRPPFEPQATVTSFVQTLNTFRVHQVTGDAFGANWVSQSFEKRGVHYKTSKLSKNEIYLEFMGIANSRQVRLVDNDRIRAQLQNLERRTGKAGHDTVDHPAGLHDDLANCIAGVTWVGLQNQLLTPEEIEKKMPIVVTPEYRRQLEAEVRGEDYSQKRKDWECQEIMDEWAKEQGWNRILKK